MSRNSSVLSAIESVDQKLISLLQRFETAAGVESLTGIESQPSDIQESTDASRSLLERLDQMVLSVSGNGAPAQNQPDMEEAFHNLSNMLSETRSTLPESERRSELLVSSWQEQLDRMEQRLNEMGEALSQPARFG